jgi:hypothetical protein
MQQVAPFGDERWEEIRSGIKFDQALSKNQAEELWTLLEEFKDVFVWHKGELGCCTIGEHAIDTQGFPPCRTTPRRLSCWEEVEVNRQIQALIKLGKRRIVTLNMLVESVCLLRRMAVGVSVVITDH